MSKFHVVVPEVWNRTYEVEAKTMEEALEELTEGDSKEVLFEFSRTHSSAYWEVEKIDE